MVPFLELLSHDSQNIRLLRASGVTPWKSSKAFWTGGEPRELGAEMSGSGALDFQGRGREQVVSRSEVGAACVCM